MNSLDPQLKSYENIIRSMEANSSAVLETAGHILVAHKAVESYVSRLSEDLPDKLDCSEKGTTDFRTVTNDKPIKVSTGTVNRGNLVLEDWLNELIIRYAADDSKDQDL